MNFLGFGQSAEIDIVFDGGETRKTVEVKGEDGKMEKLLLYYDGETVSGKVNVTLKKPGSKLEHQGIKIEFIGQIELFYDRGNHHEFKGIVKALARPGDLIQNTSYPFEFPNVEKSFETYAGSNVRLRYFLRATIVRRISDITREVDIAVHTLCSYPDLNNPIKMEVGIEDCLHIEFEYNKSKYHLKDVIVGKIYFLLVRIKIKHMEIAIIKRESTGSGPNMFTENETIAKYEIMDGAPVKGESIPIRVFLAGYSLTPTMRDINKKFSVKYFLNLVLMDTEDRRYFKQQEITLWRKADKTRKSQSLHSTNHPHAPTHLVGSVGTNVGGHDSDLQTRYGIVGSMQTSSSSVLQNPGLTDDDLMNAIGGGGVSSSSSVGGVGVINSGMTASHTDDGGLSSILSGQRGGSGETESKMGLFTRESPQQEYSQHEDSSIISSSSSSLPRSTIISSRPSAEMLRGTADGAASNSAQNDGGTAAAAALASASVISNDDFSPTSNRTAAAITRTGGGGVLEEPSTITPTTPISIPAPSSSSQFIFETQNAVMVSTTPPPLLPTTTIAATLQSTSALGVMEKDDDDHDDDGIHHQQQYTTTTATSSRKGAIPIAIPIAVPVAVSPITSGVPNVPSPSSSSSIATKTITATTKATTKTATASALTIDDEEEMINVPLNSTAFTSTKIVKRKNRADDDDDDDDYDDGKNKDNDDDIGGGGGSGVHRDSNKHD